MDSTFKTMRRVATRHAIKAHPSLSSRCRQPWRRGHTTTSGKHSDPLRILFCGTDGISAASLRALGGESRVNGGLVEAVEVVCMPPRRSGRGLKTVVPGQAMRTAEELGLRCHQIPTFTGWKVWMDGLVVPTRDELLTGDQPPEGINLVIAVSFGLFVPPRILRGAKYGGLNVHPSWLPEYGSTNIYRLRETTC